MVTFSTEVPNFSQVITIVLEAYGLMLGHVGREFTEVTNGKGEHAYLRSSLITHEVEDATTPSGAVLQVNKLSMPFSYFLAAGVAGDQKPLIHLMPQTAQDRFFGRDGSADLRHHQDDADSLGLPHLTNDMLNDLPALLADAVQAVAPAPVVATGDSNAALGNDPLGSIL